MMSSPTRPLGGHADVFYDAVDHGARPVFGSGDGFINFGFWRGGAESLRLSLNDRRRASRTLYAEVLRGIRFKPASTVIEFGCGQGAGLNFLTTRRRHLRGIGVEQSTQQAHRARERTDPSLVHIVNVPAHATGLPTSNAQAVISVEALQHFPDQRAWLVEANRLLRSRGWLCVTTFFALDERSTGELPRVLETVASGLDHAIVLDSFIAELLNVGFQIRTVRSIGEHVFAPLARWGDDVNETWPHEFKSAYDKKLLDYFVIQANTRN